MVAQVQSRLPMHTYLGLLSHHQHSRIRTYVSEDTYQNCLRIIIKSIMHHGALVVIPCVPDRRWHEELVVHYLKVVDHERGRLDRLIKVSADNATGRVRIFGVQSVTLMTDATTNVDKVYAWFGRAVVRGGYHAKAFTPGGNGCELSEPSPAFPDLTSLRGKT